VYLGEAGISFSFYLILQEVGYLAEFVQLKYSLYIHKKLLFSKSGLAFQQKVLVLDT